MNPEPERQVVEDTTDEEIYQAVMTNCADVENMEIAGGTDNSDDNAEILPCPSQRAALEAAQILGRYVGVLKDSYSQKLENLLLSFGRQTHFEEARNLVPSQITDHFNFK